MQGCARSSRARNSCCASSGSRPTWFRARPYRISDTELATRLSFFLWSSLPDQELLDAAREGRLHAQDKLESQVKRMLADPRSDALASRFAAEWLGLARLDTVTPDPLLYPNYDRTLAFSLRRETELLFDGIVRDDSSVLDLLTADYTFVDERLAAHYKIPGVLRQPVPARGDRRRAPPRPARPGQHPHDHLALGPHVAGAARQMDARATLLGVPPPPPPPDEPPLPENTERQGRPPCCRDASGSRRIARFRLCVVPRGRSTRSASRSRTTTSLGAWRINGRGRAQIDAHADPC